MENKTGMIEEITGAFGPSGFEEDVIKSIMKYMDGFTMQTDYMNNLYIPHPGNTGRKPIIQLDAHLDEVGFMVHSVNPNGTLNFVPLGGWVPSNIPAHEVYIRNREGRLIPGITASTPPHFMSQKEREAPLDITAMTIDIGATDKEEAEEIFSVAPGDPIAPKVSAHYNEETDIFTGKAFDNRMGCIAIMETLKALKDTELPVDVVGAFASQEEVGMRGAQVTAQTVTPDFAIVFEGSPADDLYFSKELVQGALKKGTQIRLMDASYISHRRFADYARNLAELMNIKYQCTVRRAGSTNAGKISLTGKAVPCLVLGIPSRFIHTHYNHCALEDLQSTVNLACEVLKNFSEDRLRHPDFDYI